MRCPLNQTSPVSGCSNPTMCLSKTLFPVPLAPITTMHLPGSMLSETSLSTTSQPKRLETCRRSIRDIELILSEEAACAVNGQVPLLGDLGEEEVEDNDR